MVIIIIIHYAIGDYILSTSCVIKGGWAIPELNGGFIRWKNHPTKQLIFQPCLITGMPDDIWRYNMFLQHCRLINNLKQHDDDRIRKGTVSGN